jgi:hypothetical protein
MEYTFKKSTCERYDIRFRKHEWAIFTIDENGGLMNCHSSFGDWSYAWPSHGRKTFKHFLIEITREPDYLLCKVSDKTYFDFDQSIRNWKKKIIEIRRAYECDKEPAREAFDFINDLEDGMSADYTMAQIYDSNALSEISSEVWEEFNPVKDYPHSAKVFANEIMSIFAEILKSEDEGPF